MERGPPPSSPPGGPGGDVGGTSSAAPPRPRSSHKRTGSGSGGSGRRLLRWAIENHGAKSGQGHSPGWAPGPVCVLRALCCVGAAFGALCGCIVLFAIVRPLSQRLYRRLACSYVQGPLIDAAAALLPGARVYVTGESHLPDGLSPAAIVCNKLVGKGAGLEWWPLLLMARTASAHSRAKLLVDSEMLKMPFIGWLLKLLEWPELHTPLQHHRQELRSQVASLLDDLPLLLLHFPEGDAICEDSLRLSDDFAKAEDRPRLRHLLLPHTSPLSACMDALVSSHPQVYDVTLVDVDSDGQTPQGRWQSWEVLVHLLCQPMILRAHIQRYPLAEVMGNAHWLDDRWKEKERLLSHFAWHRSFPKEGHTFTTPRTFDTKSHQFAGSYVTAGMLMVLPCLVPTLCILSIPLLVPLISIGLGLRFARSILARSGLISTRKEEEEECFSIGGGSRPNTPWLPSTPLNTPSFLGGR